MLPAWGYLDKIELLPHDDLPNMDASRPYRLFGELLAPDGRRIPVDVYAVCSNVE